MSRELILYGERESWGPPQENVKLNFTRCIPGKSCLRKSYLMWGEVGGKWVGSVDDGWELGLWNKNFTSAVLQVLKKASYRTTTCDGCI